MRIKHKVNVLIADDTSMKDMLFGFDDELAEVITDAYGRMASGIMNIDAADTESMPTGDVDAIKGVYLKMDTEVKLDINGLGDIQVRKVAIPTSTYAKFFFEGDITSISIENPGTSAARIIWCVWGDAV